jgi:hypothetical protein
MEKTVITLSSEKLATVEKWSKEGLCTNSKKIKMDDLMISILSMMYPEDVVQAILGDDGLIEEIIEPILENTDDMDQITSMLSILLKRVDEKEDQEIVRCIFKALADQYDLSQLDGEVLNHLLTMILRRVKQLDHPESYHEMLDTLLKRLPIADLEGRYVGRILQDVATYAKNTEDRKTIQEMFYILSRKAEKEWIREILAPYVQKQKIVRSPILPKGCILYQEELDGTKLVVIEVEKQKWDTTYHATNFKQVGFPKLLFLFALKNKKVRAKVVAVKDTLVKPSTKLYRYPYSNVFDDFSTCWPDLQGIKITDLYQLTTLPHLFITSPNNDHAYRGKNLRERFVRLQGQDFDDDELESTGLTFKKYFEL